MSEPTLQDLKDLLLSLDKKMEVQMTAVQGELRQLEERVDRVESTLTAKIDGVESTLNVKIEGLEAKLTAKIDGVQSTLTENIDGVQSMLTEKIDGVESTLTEKIDGLGKRMDNREFISRGAIITLVGGVLTGLIKYLFFVDS